MPPTDVAEAGGDLADGIVPVDRYEVAGLGPAWIRASEWPVEAVRIVVHPEIVHTLVAREALVDGMVLVRLQPDDPIVLDLTICGRDFQLLNGGDVGLTPNMMVSLMVETADQAETDRIWDAILAAGGTAVQCGWITDPYGYSWQITPRILNDALADKDRKVARAAFEAMMPMVKIDVAAIEAAIEIARANA